MAEQRFLRPLLYLVAGLLVWAIHFGAIYAANALACARGLGDANLWGLPAVPVAITAATLVAVAALGAIALAAWFGKHPALPKAAAPRTEHFLDRMALTVTGLAALGVVWEALPAYLLPPCG